MVCLHWFRLFVTRSRSWRQCMRRELEHSRSDSHLIDCTCYNDNFKTGTPTILDNARMWRILLYFYVSPLYCSSGFKRPLKWTIRLLSWNECKKTRDGVIAREFTIRGLPTSCEMKYPRNTTIGDVEGKCEVLAYLICNNIQQGIQMGSVFYCHIFYRNVEGPLRALAVTGNWQEWIESVWNFWQAIPSGSIFFHVCSRKNFFPLPIIRSRYVRVRWFGPCIGIFIA